MAEKPATNASASANPNAIPIVAYKDENFVDSDEARPLRILAEYLQPLEVFRRQRVKDTIVFFGSARLGADGPMGRFVTEARELARLNITKLNKKQQNEDQASQAPAPSKTSIPRWQISAA